jgi:hypothetical protein
MASEQAGGAPAGRRIPLRIRYPAAPRTSRDTSPETDAPKPKLHTTPVQHAAATVGAVFGLMGVLGFLPGITAHLDGLEVAGHHSGAMLFGLFSVSLLHNVVHLLFALVGLALATTPGSARGFLFGGGAIYLLLWLYGLVIHQPSSANFVPLNTADNWLHLVLGVGMIGLGLLTSTRR